MGIADHVLESISGHLSRRMLEHYSHIRIDAKRQALDALDEQRKNGLREPNGDEAPDIQTIVEISEEVTSQLRHSLTLSGDPPHGKLLIPLNRRDVRVVEGARLESDFGDAHRVIPKHSFTHFHQPLTARNCSSA